MSAEEFEKYEAPEENIELDEDNHEVSNNENDENHENSEQDGNQKKRIIKAVRQSHRRPTLDVMRLTGPRGIGDLEIAAKNVKLKGKNHEKEDLNEVISLLRLWSHRLYPKMTFMDCMEKIETLGIKKPVQTYLTKIRLGMIDVIVADDEPTTSATAEAPTPPILTEEQKERIFKSRMMAQARRNAKLKKQEEAVFSNNVPDQEMVSDEIL